MQRGRESRPPEPGCRWFPELGRKLYSVPAEGYEGELPITIPKEVAEEDWLSIVIPKEVSEETPG